MALGLVDLQRTRLRLALHTALDCTGLEKASALAHFTSRAGRKRTKPVKLMQGVLCASVVPCALAADWGPSHDVRRAWEVRDKLLEACRPTMLWGDSAFDCEEWRGSGWKDLRVPTYAPTVVRTQDEHVNGFYRRVLRAPVKESEAALKVDAYAINV